MPPTKTLSNIVLSEFLELVLGPVVDKISVSPSIAKQIEQCDKEESLCHIEWPTESNGLVKPRLWRIDDWRTDYKNTEYRKAVNFHERQVQVLASELKAILLRKLMIQTGLGSDDLRGMADAIVKSRQPKACETFGVSMDELAKAEDALAQFKQQNSKKKE